MNPQVQHIERQERKINKSKDYVTSSLSDQGLHHHNTSKMFNYIPTTVYYTLVVCCHAQRNGEKRNKKRREGSYLHEWHLTNCLSKPCMSVYEWKCRTMCTCTVLIVNLPAE